MRKALGRGRPRGPTEGADGACAQQSYSPQRSAALRGRLSGTNAMPRATAPCIKARTRWAGGAGSAGKRQQTRPTCGEGVSVAEGGSYESCLNTLCEQLGPMNEGWHMRDPSGRASHRAPSLNRCVVPTRSSGLRTAASVSGHRPYRWPRNSNSSRCAVLRRADALVGRCALVAMLSPLWPPEARLASAVRAGGLCASRCAARQRGPTQKRSGSSDKGSKGEPEQASSHASCSMRQDL